ncbi:MAG TPA: HEAT repeat domain-containing protein [Thermoanaerobaculia bacterium]|nr:HEAT repeat domain-containing protein [Thermoanaerobaculia bacterium]
MDIIVGGVLMGSSLLVLYLLGLESLRDWKAAAELCGLQDVEISWVTRKVKARAGEIEVRIEVSGEQHRPARIVVAVPGPPGFRDVSIRGAPLFRVAAKTGDPSFESRFVVEGPEPLVAALLDEETRRLLSRWGFIPLWLSSGELLTHVTDLQIFDVLPGLVEIGRRFAQPLDIPRRLAENATQDPKPGVRLQNLRLLIRELPDDPRTTWALREACSDSSPEIRLRAAKEVGAEGRGVLLELAEGLKDDAISAEAVSSLGRELPFESTTAILKRALRRRRFRTACACLESIGCSGAAAVDILTEVLERKKGELAVAAARALRATGSQTAEPSLIHALQRDQEDLRMAAAEALGRVGSAAAVLPLQEAAERSLLDLDLRRVARQAIAEIQSRLEGASPGQLSLAGTEAGQLSLSETGEGQLSLTEDPAGQLSLPPDEGPA